VKIEVLPKLVKFNKIFYAKDLDEAYGLGYFSGSMTRWELLERITRYNPQLREHANKTHRGIYDSDRSKFCLGITYGMVIPKHSILKYDKSRDRQLIYSDEFGEPTGSEIINKDPEQHKVLVRGWLNTLEMLNKNYKIDWKGL